MFREEIDFIVQAYLEGQPIACFLIEYFGNEEFTEELNTLADNYLYSKIYNKTKLSDYPKAVIAVSLTMIALCKYLNGNFYDAVRMIYQRCYSTYNVQTVEKHIREVLETFRERCKYWDGKSDVAVPLVSCVVPYYRLKDLFAISFDIYRKNLLLDPDASSSQIRAKVRQVYQDFVRKDLVSDEDIIKGTQYLMSTYTQSCIKTGVYLDDLILITSECIELIKDHVWGIDEKKPKQFYLKGTEKWKAQYDSNEENKTEKNERSRKAFFSLDRDNLLLTTKAITMPDYFDPNDVWLLIGDKKIELTDIDLNTKNTVGDEYIVQEKTINLKEINVNPFQSLSYKIICGGEEIYDSEDVLKRDILFFSLDSGKEIKQGSDFNGEVICVSREKPLFEGVSLLYSNSLYFVTQFNVNPAVPVIIGDKAFVFSSIKGTKDVSTVCDWIYFQNIDEEKTIPFFTSFETILFETSTPIEMIKVLDCGKENNSYKVILNASGDNHVNTVLIKLSGIEEGYHSIEIVNRTTNKLIRGLKKIEFIIDPVLEKAILIEEDACFVSIKSSVLGSLKLKYDISEDEILHTGLVKNYRHGVFHICPEIFAYSKNNGQDWVTFDKRLYFDDIKDYSKKVLIRCPFGVKCYFRTGAYDRFINLIRLEGYVNTYECYLAALQTHSEVKHLQLSFANHKISQTLFVDFVPLVDRANVLKVYDDKTNTHSFIYTFSGPDKVKCVICDPNSIEPICQFVIGSGEEFHPYQLKPFVKYRVSFYCKSKGLLGYERTPFFVDEYSFFDVQQMKGRSYKINSVDIEIYLKTSSGKLVPKRAEVKMDKKDYFLCFVNNDSYNPGNPMAYFGKIVDNSYWDKNKPIFNIGITVLEFQDDSHVWVSVKQYDTHAINDLKKECTENGETFELDPEDPDIYNLLMVNTANTSFIPETKMSSITGFIEKILINLKENR